MRGPRMARAEDIGYATGVRRFSNSAKLSLNIEIQKTDVVQKLRPHAMPG